MHPEPTFGFLPWPSRHRCCRSCHRRTFCCRRMSAVFSDAFRPTDRSEDAPLIAVLGWLRNWRKSNWRKVTQISSAQAHERMRNRLSPGRQASGRHRRTGEPLPNQLLSLPCSGRVASCSTPSSRRLKRHSWRIIVVGGHSRSVGKTSVVAGLIAALPEFGWTAIKVTQYGHGICSTNGELCDCATDDHTLGGHAKSATGPGRATLPAFWLPAQKRFRCGCEPRRQGLFWLESHALACAEELAQAQNAIVESNSVIRFIRPDLYLTVLDPATPDFKLSAQNFLDRADLIVVHDYPAEATWANVSLKAVLNKPQIRIHPPAHTMSPPNRPSSSRPAMAEMESGSGTSRDHAVSAPRLIVFAFASALV